MIVARGETIMADLSDEVGRESPTRTSSLSTGRHGAGSAGPKTGGLAAFEDLRFRRPTNMKAARHWTLRDPFFRYLVTGGLAALVEYSSFVLLVYVLAVGVIPAHMISLYAGFLVSFFVNRNWSFRSRGRMSLQFLGSNGLLAVNMALSAWLLDELVDRTHASVLLCKVLVMACVCLWNFVVFRWLIFPRRTAVPTVSQSRQ